MSKEVIVNIVLVTHIWQHNLKDRDVGPCASMVYEVMLLPNYQSSCYCIRFVYSYGYRLSVHFNFCFHLPKKSKQNYRWTLLLALPPQNLYWYLDGTTVMSFFCHNSSMVSVWHHHSPHMYYVCLYGSWYYEYVWHSIDDFFFKLPQEYHLYVYMLLSTWLNKNFFTKKDFMSAQYIS